MWWYTYIYTIWNILRFHSSPHHPQTWLAGKAWAWGVSVCVGHSRRWCRRRGAASKDRTLPSLHTQSVWKGPVTEAKNRNRYDMCLHSVEKNCPVNNPHQQWQLQYYINVGTDINNIWLYPTYRNHVSWWPTKSCLTRSLALGKNFSGNSYSSFIIFWNIRYSFLQHMKYRRKRTKRD